MNNTLNNRINFNLTQIVGSYTLPSTEIIKNNREKCSTDLIHSTLFILNDLYLDLHRNCEKYKFERIRSTHYDYWIIRKLKY